MKLTSSQQKALSRALEGKNLFITGVGGTGKSFLLRVIVEKLGHKNVAVTALTGLAAKNVGGITLHSFAGMGHDLSKKVNSFAKSRWKRTQVLIVDEVSMLTSTFLEKLYPWVVENDIQLIFFGDLLQLPPVNGKLCIESPKWSLLGLDEGTIELLEVVRQKDQEFIRVLNQVRTGQLTKETIAFLKKLEITQKKIDPHNITKLYALNRDVDKENLKRLNKLSGPLVILKAEDRCSERRPSATLTQMINKEAPQEIKIKVGALVMVTRNIPPRLVNGMIGTVESCDPLTVAFHNATPPKAVTSRVVTPPKAVEFKGGLIEIPCVEYKAKFKRDQIIRKQYPIKLAWNLTVHRGQGMTLKNVYAAVKGSFENGQIYTVLSRAETPEGLCIDDVDYIIKNNKVSDVALEYYESN